ARVSRVVAACPVALALAVAASAPARSQEHYPARTITVVVPLTPGTVIDILARLYAESLSQRLGQQVIVANRPGAGGLIGAQAVGRGPARAHAVRVAQSRRLR